MKLGTSTITHPNGKLNYGLLEQIVRQLSDAANRGKEVIVVTSGAVGAGLSRLGMTERPKTIPEKQAAAAVGQGLLMQTYETLFSQYGHIVAQVLLTRGDITDRNRHLNARNTLVTLLKNGVIPIINENDTVSVDELRFGDNDRLAALVSGLVDADLLVLLSDVDGVYDADPRSSEHAQLIPLITDPTEWFDVAGGPGSRFSSGGMATKLQAAHIAIQQGCAVIVANGSNPGVIYDILAGKTVGSLFVPEERRLDMRKRWIALFQTPQGELEVDAGASAAILGQGKSLLPIGVTAVRGNFQRGDLVQVFDASGQEIARGLVNYSSLQVEKIKGQPTEAIPGLLGQDLTDEVIHRDNLVITHVPVKES